MRGRRPGGAHGHLAVLIFLIVAHESQSEGEGSQQPLSIREWYGTIGLTSSPWFAGDSPGFSPESPQSLENQEGWSL